MLYDERGRGIVAQNGQTVIIDREGVKWLIKETEPVKVDVAEWNEYTVIARGNRLIHKLNGQVTTDVIDHQESERELEGLLAIQIHRGPAMKVEIKDIILRGTARRRGAHTRASPRAARRQAARRRWQRRQEGEEMTRACFVAQASSLVRGIRGC